MSSATEGKYSGDFLKEEFSPNFCREKKTILAGSGSARELLAGMVVSQVKTGAASAITGTGNGVVTLGALGALAKTGVYILTCITAAANAGTFEVEDPEGNQLASNVTVAGGATNVDGHFTVTIADGATDFIVGDSFTVTISDGKIVQYDDTATDTKKIPVGILIADATAADGVDGTGVVLVRGPAIISKADLLWPSTADSTEKTAAYAELLKLNILAVQGV